VEGFIPKEIIDKRYEIINNFEKMLEANGTKILKFYLHISKEVQKEKLTDRINLPEKHWKHNDGDWAVREKWDQYMDVYETIFERCNDVPWHIIPADNNKEKANAISKIVIKTFEEMDLEYPDLKSELFTPEN
jgi:polyphosphate kinase 2 (PPK2 family)